MKALGLDVEDIEGEKTPYRKLPRGKTLHGPVCPQVRRKPLVEARLSLPETEGYSFHTCLNWAQTSVGVKLKENRGVLNFLDEIKTLEETRECLPLRAKMLQLALSDVRYTNVVGALPEDTKARIETLVKRITPAAAAAPFVLKNLAYPPEALKLASGGEPGGERIVKLTWERWATAKSQDETAQKARQEALKTYQFADTLFRNRGNLPVWENCDPEKLIDAFERHLKRACAKKDKEVLVASAGRYYGDYIDESLGSLERLTSENGLYYRRPGVVRFEAAACLFPSRKFLGYGSERVVVKVPEKVAYSFAGDHDDPLVWLGSAQGPTDALMETFVTLWQPESRDGPYASALNAFNAAKELV